MTGQVIHSATITLRLPLYTSVAEEESALQAAGIPIDAIGNAASGFLFVRHTSDRSNPAKIFRWFAAEVGRAPA
ncbi:MULTISPECIES: hypothetical protein [unclassified Variovorax]|jgi:hypothetical protein|uniref:hypothetical protein n=1 Tax=Variovorax TaxID=34072 RepID=UPI000F7F4410|nr:hypothetical protein [Variovorax sp. 369]RTD85399.1 hypothetical protein EJO68_30215 [Variovorax sp. 369]